MADIDLKDAAVSGREIGLSDFLLGFSTTRDDDEAPATDTLTELILKILQNPPSGLSDTEKKALLDETLPTFVALGLIVLPDADGTLRDAVEADFTPTRRVAFDGSWQRAVQIPGTDFAITWTPLASGATVNFPDGTSGTYIGPYSQTTHIAQSDAVSGRVYYNRTGHTWWLHDAVTWNLKSSGPTGGWLGHHSGEEAANNEVSANGQYIEWGGTVRLSSAYTAHSDATYDWHPIAAGGPSHFIDLQDTPSSLVADRMYRVNSAGDAIVAISEIPDSMIPSGIMRDSELTAASVRTLLGLTATEVNDLLTGASLSGGVITFAQNDGTTATITLPDSADDGIISGFSFSEDSSTITITRTVGDDITVSVPELLRGSGTTLSGRGEPPEATSERVGQRYLDLTSKVLYGCFDDPHRTSESTGDFTDISRNDIKINLNDPLESITVVENEWLYRVSSNRFYAGTDVGSNQLAWVDDDADDALASSLETATNEVVWLGRHLDNEEALQNLTAIESGKEYFFYREQDGTIDRLDNSSFSAAGSTVAHPFWLPIKADDREELIFDARDGLPEIAGDGSDDNRIGVTNEGLYVVDVDPISATDPTADSWADYTATDYEGAFAADPTIDTGHWYANYTRRTFREFESTNFGLGWIPHAAPDDFIGWFTSRQDALDHAPERGVASGGDFSAFTGADSDPKVETATNFSPAASATVRRNWVFMPVAAADDTKADTDLQNLEDLSDTEEDSVLTQIGLVRDHSVQSRYVVAADGTTVTANHRWNGNFYEVKRDFSIKKISAKVHPSVDDTYYLSIFRVTMEGDEDFQFVSGSEDRSSVINIDGGAEATISYTPSTPYALTEGQYVWVGVYSSGQSHARTVREDNAAGTAVDAADLLDFAGWSQFNGTGSQGGTILTSNIWHSNANNGRFYAEIEAVAFDESTFVMVEDNGFLASLLDKSPVINFEGAGVTVKAGSGNEVLVNIPGGAVADSTDGTADSVSFSYVESTRVLTVTIGRTVGADLTDSVTLPSGGTLSSTTPSAHGIGQSGAAGTATDAARSDHVHAIPVGVPVAIGSANAEGTATTAVRSDHVHAGAGTIHTTGTAFPASPATNQLFSFNADATGIDAKDDDGTTDITTASKGDLFKYDGTDWVRQVGSATGALTVTPRTEAAHNYSFDGTIQSGQDRDLFDSNITLPTGIAEDEGFILRVLATHGAAEIILTKDLLEELVAVTPVTWTTSATGTSAIQVGATRNAYFIPLGQNRGFYVGRSTEDPLRLLWAYTHTGAVVLDMQLFTLTAGASAAASESGQESPEPGVTELTADRVSVIFYAYDTATKDAPTASWRFDDEWDDQTAPGSEGWYTSEADALTNAELDPDFATSGYYLQIAQETVRRRLNSDGDAYTYTDSGYTVTAAWDIQYSTNGIESHETYDSVNDDYVRYRGTDGTLGPWIPIGTNVGANTWNALVTHQNVYPGGSDYDNVVVDYDFGLFSDLLFIMAGFRDVTVEVDGEDEVQRHLGPIHSFVLKRGGGFDCADASDGEDNNGSQTGPAYQWSYNNEDGLLIWRRGDNVNPDVVDFAQASAEPPTQVGGIFKIVSTNGDEAHVQRLRFFQQSHDYGRMDMSLYARFA